MGPTDHLLRTLAAVAPGTRVVEVGCGEGHHTEPLVRLGFDVWACDGDPAAVEAARDRLAGEIGEDEATRRVAVMKPDVLGFPDDYADWGVMTTLPEEPSAHVEAFRDIARVLRPGAWVWVQAASPDGLVEAAEAAGLAIAEAPAAGPDGTHAIFRRPAEVA